MAQVRLEFILFGALLQQPQTGYELQRFMETTGRFMRANTSMTQVYRSLRAMEGRGWLSHEIEPRRGARHAKRYRVTPVGRSTFFGWLRESYQPTELSDEVFFTQARFRAQYLGRDAAIEVADVEIAVRRRHIARNRDRDRTEWYEPGAPIEVELTSALVEWLHRRGVARMDRTLAGYIELRELLTAGVLPSDDAPMLLQPSVFDDLPTTKETS